MEKIKDKKKKSDLKRIILKKPISFMKIMSNCKTLLSKIEVIACS